jgi:N utilization substance protein B
MADMREQDIETSIKEYYGSLASEESEPVTEQDAFALELARGATGRRDEIDALIAAHSDNWRLERMPVVDRNILRVAIYELLSLPTPTAVVIDQALDLATRYSSEESLPFLNGVLDAVNKKLRP